MSTRELVVRIAEAFGGWPHEVWHWPLHYYLAVRREFIKIHFGKQQGSASSDINVTERRVVGPGIVVEKYDRPG